MSDPLDLAPIEARLKAATPGPWRWVAVSGGWDGVAAEGGPDICRLSLNLGANAILIAHAPTDIAALVAEVRRLQAALQTARVDGARAMRERAAKILDECEAEQDRRDEDGIREMVGALGRDVRRLDPATVADEAPAASQPAPVVLANCRTCAHDFRDQEGRVRCWQVEEMNPVVDDWIADDANLNEDGEPTPTATGCPGWRARV